MGQPSPDITDSTRFPELTSRRLQVKTSVNLFNTPSGTGNPSQYDFFFADPNTVYIVDDRTQTNGGGLQKWTFNGTAWSRVYTLFPGASPGSIAGTTNTDGTVSLYIVTQISAGNNKIIKATDTITNTDPTQVPFADFASSGTNLAFRGIVVLNPVIKSTIALDGVANVLATAQPVGPATVRVKSGATDQSFTAPASQFGAFYIGGLAGASYQVGATGDRQLRSVKTVNTAAASASTSFLLLSGDTDASNAVDLTDLINLLNVYGSVAGDPNYVTRPQADTNYDGAVDLTDLIDLLNNYGATGGEFAAGRGVGRGKGKG